MLRLNDIHQTFHTGEINEVRALRGIDLELLPGQFVTVIGSNGAGKSTLFNAIAGVFAPSQGQIVIDGVDVTTWSEHRRAALIGRVFQDPLLGTAASMTIAQNLTLASLRSQRLGWRTGVTPTRRQQFHDLLAPLGLGLETRLDSRVSLLSGGQRQALTLVMATLANPKIVLLDEHTAALDPATAARILTLTSQFITHQQLTTLMITHNMQQALANGDSKLMMDGGRIVLDISGAERQQMTVQGLIDRFSQVRHSALVEDELLLAS
ncbi:MAG: ATP-binding cassette domain-containing protein [Caldilineaceae bacterium]|nr:ATP-binding cassette domain-containing protein [Caldilineaceae bacterium]